MWCITWIGCTEICSAQISLNSAVVPYKIWFRLNSVKRYDNNLDQTMFILTFYLHDYPELYRSQIKLIHRGESNIINYRVAVL